MRPKLDPFVSMQNTKTNISGHHKHISTNGALHRTIQEAPKDLRLRQELTFHQYKTKTHSQSYNGVAYI